MEDKVSVTSLQHHILASLEASPFYDLYAVDYNDNSEFYSFDTFRRLYNDAVESMLHYRLIALEQYSEISELHSRCHELECSIRELSDIDD